MRFGGDVAEKVLSVVAVAVAVAAFEGRYDDVVVVVPSVLLQNTPLLCVHYTVRLHMCAPSFSHTFRVMTTLVDLSPPRPEPNSTLDLCPLNMRTQQGGAMVIHILIFFKALF